MNDTASETTAFAAEREQMVCEQLAGFPPRVLTAMSHVPRHKFLPDTQKPLAYADHAVPIGFGQTISQPYIVALMTSQLDPQPTDRVLEIGTGSGYQAAVLAQLVAEVYSVEIIGPLAKRATSTLRQLGCENVHVRVGDGASGWPEAAPFDAVIVTCAPEKIPTPLVAQLKDGGKFIIPLGPSGDQELVVCWKRAGRLEQRETLPVRFVPMTGAMEPPR